MKHSHTRNAAGLLLALLLAFQLAAPAGAVGSGTGSEAGLPSIRGADKVSAARIQEELRQLPAPVLQAFVERGWSLHMDKSYLADLSARYGDLCIAATCYKDQRIYLLGSRSTLHEFGHFLDWALYFPETVDALYEAEADNAGFLRAYAKSSREEYFADCFALWVRSGKEPSIREEMRTAVPDTYAYFEALEADGWILE